MIRRPGRPPTLAVTGRQEVEDALAGILTLIHDTAAVAERTDPDPLAAAPYPNGALHWYATRTLDQLVAIHSALGARWYVITALIDTQRQEGSNHNGP